MRCKDFFILKANKSHLDVITYKVYPKSWPILTDRFAIPMENFELKTGRPASMVFSNKDIKDAIGLLQVYISNLGGGYEK